MLLAAWAIAYFWSYDQYLAYDAQASRVRTEKVSKDKVYPIGPEVVYDGERCITPLVYHGQLSWTHRFTLSRMKGTEP